MSKAERTILDLVGQTPIVKLQHSVPADAADVYVKLEYFNPGSSVKDRIALAMIEKAEAEGKLTAGGTIVEPTSGNTGIGLAMVGAAKGYQVVIVMPDTMSIERRKLMQAYGAQLILTPGAEGIKGSIAKAQELAEANGWFLPLQFENPENPLIHELTTGKEIVETFAGETLDAFVAGIGTGGTITGAGRALRKAYPDILIYGVEPAESAVLEGGQPGPHKIQGIGTGFVPATLDTAIYDEAVSVTSEAALATARKIGQTEGLLVGISAGAAINAALTVAAELGAGKKVLAIVPDNGERYLSTALYQFED